MFSKILEIILRQSFFISQLQKKISEVTETMVVEDLAAIEDINEEKIMNVLHDRFKRGFYYTYIGDILIFLNPNTRIHIYGNKVSSYCEFSVLIRVGMFINLFGNYKTFSSIIQNTYGNQDQTIPHIFMHWLMDHTKICSIIRNHKI